MLSAVIAFTTATVTPQPSYGASWIELLLRGAQIIQLSTISDSQEIKLGKQINQELLKQNKIKLNKNARINSYLNELGQRLAKYSERPNISYTFQVVNDRNINAFATMGGFVYVNTGTMIAADNEAELASVVAHEIGHIAGRHAIEQMRSRAIAQGVLSAAGLDEKQAVQIGVQLAVELPNSREDEYEADRLGLDTIKKAGYAPSGMISFMQKLLQKSRGGSVPSFLSTHPATQDRITSLQQAIDQKNSNAGNGLNSQNYKRQISPLL
jgi:predicted Zn-dependent protease